MISVKVDTWTDRKELAILAEQKVFGMLLFWNISARKIGQETWMPNWVHDKLRYDYSDSIKTIRHFPDIDTGKALVEIKNSPNGDKFDSVFIEKDSFDTCLMLSDRGISVLIVWMIGDNLFMAQWTNKLNPIMPKVERQNTKGSRTPYYEIYKNELLPFKNFKNEL